ncbi:MAG: ECF transporter S component [Lachnospiraceae bacterium]|nr:ECF transporter S component [Lachnospiraceae bacterium]
MNKNNSTKWDIPTICFIGVMAALVCAVTWLRIPFLGSKVHFANAFCLLSGMLLGPVPGGLAAGIGSALYDAYTGYDIAGILITFVSKFAMAWICAKLMPEKEDSRLNLHRTVLASIAGALSYVFLYMLKTYVYQRLVYGFPLDAVGVTMWSKFIPSLINALFAVIAAPILYHALKPALQAMGIKRN